MMVSNNRGFSLRYLFYLLQFLIFCELRFLKVEAIKGENVVDVDGDEFPFVCSIGSNTFKESKERNHFCGGTLISNRHILTAAHCVIGQRKTDLRITCGSADLRSINVQIYGVLRWVTYEMWAQLVNIVQDKSINDIAVILVDQISSVISPVTLSPENRSTLKKSKVVMVGWGSTNSETNPRIMQKVYLDLISRKNCQKRVKRITPHLWKYAGGDETLCAASEPPALGNSGDSGSPILDEKKQLIGIYIGRCPKSEENSLSGEIIPRRVNLGLMVGYFSKFLDDSILML